MSAPRLTDTAKAEIVRRYDAGDPIKVIAADYGVDQSYPTLLAKRHGIGPRSRRPQTASPSPPGADEHKDA